MKDISKQELIEIIKESFGISQMTPTLAKHITKYVIEEHMTYGDIARCIVYFNEVKGKPLEAGYGLSFITNWGIKEEAANYFRQLELKKIAQEQEAQQLIAAQKNNIIFNIKKMPKGKRKAKHFDISAIDVEGDHKDDN